MRILIYDNKQASSRYASLLISQGALTDTFSDADNALHSLKKFCPDVFIISTHVLCEKHCALVSRYRKRGYRTPVIVTATESSKKLRMAAFEAGADDVVSGETEPEELVARINALHRLCLGYSQNRIALPPYELDIASRQLTKDGAEVALTNFEYIVTESLMKKNGKVVTRDEIMNQLYSDAELRNPDVLNVLICRLKKKLCQGSGFKIKSIRNIGYIFRPQ